MRLLVLSCALLFGCAATAPGGGYRPDGSADSGVTPSDGGSWTDSGQCPPMTYAGSPCKGTVSCWADCFVCLGNPPTWDKHAPISYRCINSEYGAMGSVTCWNGKFRDNRCTIPSDGGK